MPRQARLDICGLVYHAMARGIERREIFQDEKDCDGLIDRLGGLVVQAGARLYAWSLLPDHFHLILRRRGAAAGVEKAGGYLPTQGVQYTLRQGKNHEGDDRHALNMAAFRIPRLLW